MRMVFGLSTDGQYLELKSFEKKHNHSITKENFNLLPKQRKLNMEIKDEVRKLKQLKCNNVLLKEYVEQKTGKRILLRDLSNIKFNNNKSTNLKKVVEVLETQEGAIVKLLVTENEVLSGIFFQNKEMKNTFNVYPQILLLDGTYKLNNLRMPLYILLSINGNNEGDIIAIFLLEQETCENITVMLNFFKSYNPLWDKTQVILTDKDFSERNALQSAFPNANLKLCLFHTLKAFRSAITMQTMSITSVQRDCILNMLQCMAYAKSEQEYNNSYESLKNMDCPLVTSYFETNWHPIKEEWVKFHKENAGCFKVHTTNHLESINNKIKKVCTKFNSLDLFFEEFLIFLKSMYTEKKAKANNMVYKKVNFISLSQTENEYYKLLTPFAFDILQKKIKNFNKIQIELRDGNYYYKAKNNEYNSVSETMCSCSFYKDLGLPCEHIFMLRSLKKMALFCETLISDRFKKLTYIKCYSESNLSNNDDLEDPNLLPGMLLNDGDSNNTANEIITVLPQKHVKTLSQSEKYKLAMAKCQKFCSAVAEIGTDEFYQCINKFDIFCENIFARNSHIHSETISPQNEGKGVNPSRNENDSCEDVEFVISTSSVPSTIPSVSNNFIENTAVMLDNNLAEGNDMILQDLPIDIIPFDVPVDSVVSNFAEPIPSSSSSIHEYSPDHVSIPVNEPDENFAELSVHSSEIVPNIAIDNIQLPTIIKRKGRPKGFATTVVGLPKKKKSITIFNKKSIIEKQKIILKGIFNENTNFINSVLHDRHIVTMEEIKKYIALQSHVFEEEISFELVEQFFKNDAFCFLKELIQMENNNNIKYFCSICKITVASDTKCIRCDSCLNWVHKNCSGLKKLLTKRNWFCPNCKY